MYQYQAAHRQKNRRGRRIFWLVLMLIFIVAIAAAVIFIRAHSKPQETIKQAAPVTTRVTYASKTKHYDEPGFGIDLPTDWQPAPTPAGPYNFFRWITADGQQLQVYEDTIPTTFAVNRVLIVESAVDRLQLDGAASDNCSQFTKSLSAAPNQVGVPAKWQGVSFLCDQFNQERDVIGTSSTDGVNTVDLRQPTTGASHKFFFVYNDSTTNPDYTVFYSALQSFHLE